MRRAIHVRADAILISAIELLASDRGGEEVAEAWLRVRESVEFVY